ncbi:hypothetical protein GCM10007176_01010 [Salinicoccus roseus]|mgnify:FL=1|jgi:hypothetical protein|uniref:Uncharacterized protein n=2 Tax=Salinicoccus roseus TaxID=45670 RepID=A0A0C2DNT9_9STAP|nr:hypothetical protein [Salinicoccus sp. RF5]KIH71673.1 hypothetical protein SN16_03140 [Salinicoccus roseus]MBY8910329.1 hypothetical protein [Salinicoccus roseus]OZT77199.1 hypothetical protein CFN03_09000 [Salinicoccus roseus]RPE55068.1 hypothetical protein EDC33_1333 [Salinicoccus roseus]GGA60331.1 hypothetical protein GCM10007176_01010 [Salinicoccus roseus]|tara:strand:- start:363 stop:575 length:213 start_codon:yes stop_codon:yes gene_type:complete
MLTLFLIILVIAIVMFTHFVVTYLIENDVKIVGVLLAFVGVIAAIIIVQFIISGVTDFVADELDIFYRDN